MLEAIQYQKSQPAPLFAFLPHIHREGTLFCGLMLPSQYPRVLQNNMCVGLTPGYHLNLAGTILGLPQSSPKHRGYGEIRVCMI